MNAQLKPQPQFARESGKDVLGEIQPLLDEQANEVSYKQSPVCCDYDRYLRVEAAGALRIYTIRYLTQLVGYAIFTVAPNSKFMPRIEASQESLFLSAAYRQGSLGLRFLRWIEAQLWSEPQICEIHLSGNLNKNIEPLFQRMGYERRYYVYSRCRNA